MKKYPQTMNRQGTWQRLSSKTRAKSWRDVIGNGKGIVLFGGICYACPVPL